MPRLMLDTNICIYTIKHQPPQVRVRLEAVRPQDVAISGIVAAELWFGVVKSRRRQHNERALRDFLGFVEVVDWPREAAPLYGELRSRLEARGRPIGNMDTLIAAHALYERATLVTRNRGEFERVEGLQIDCWES
jgi:tRNA(fMet)-specific endonuclease VapC